MTSCCRETVLDLHNIESVLHERCAGREPRPDRARDTGDSRRVAKAGIGAASALSAVLRRRKRMRAGVRAIAPGARVKCIRIRFRWVEVPHCDRSTHGGLFGQFRISPEYRRGRISGRARSGPKCARSGRNSGCVWWGAAMHSSVICCPGRRGGDRYRSNRGGRGRAGPRSPRRGWWWLRCATGSGTRIKILEAWAAARAVVATSLAAEGLEAEDGVERSLLEADAETVRGAGGERCLPTPETRQRAGGGRASYVSRTITPGRRAGNASILILQITRSAWTYRLYWKF